MNTPTSTRMPTAFSDWQQAEHSALEHARRIGETVSGGRHPSPAQIAALATARQEAHSLFEAMLEDNATRSRSLDKH